MQAAGYGEGKTSKHMRIFAVGTQWKISIHYQKRNICRVQQTTADGEKVGRVVGHKKCWAQTFYLNPKNKNKTIWCTG